MAAAAAAEGLFRCVFEGCISTSDTDIERRPYHKNCNCALHRSSSNKTSSSSNCSKANKKLAYPMRRSWSEGCLALSSSSSSNISNNNNLSPCNSNCSSSCSSPVVGKGKPPRSLFKVESLDCMYKPDLNY